MCVSWKEGSCKNEGCAFLHPEADKEIEKTQQSNKQEQTSKGTSFPVIVKNLNVRTSQQTLFNKFKSFGRLIEDGIKICKNKKGISTGMAYINYTTEDGARSALMKMNGVTIDGSQISVEEYCQKPKPPEIDYRPLTDCRFFIQGKCTKQDCPYRHLHSTDSKSSVCVSWKGGSCKNEGCAFLHPEADKEIEKTRLASQLSKFKENMHVEVQVGIHKQIGVIRWVGIISELGNEEIAGIELAKEVDHGSDGEFQGKRYFNCKKKHGIFLKTSLCKVVRIGLNTSSQMSEESKQQSICGYYLNNTCKNGNCINYHPPYLLPYCWFYQLSDEKDVNICPKELSEKIEKEFCNVDKSTCLMQLDSFTQISVNFDDLTSCQYKGSPATFTRVSTRSDCVDGDEPHKTRWIWYWQDDGNQWHEYITDGSTTSERLEKSYLSNEKGNYPFIYTRYNYQISFPGMQQTNLKTAKRRKIRRRPLPITKERPNDVVIKNEVVYVKRQTTLDFPVTWKTIPTTGFKKYGVSEDVSGKIKEKFFKTMPQRNHCIVSIEEIANKEHYSKLLNKKKLMEETNKGSSNKMNLWHGTKNEFVEMICHQNFDWRMVSTHAYGKGSYFARDASYSHSFTRPDSTGICSMFYAEVLVGSYTKGHKGYNRPPPREGLTLYDSCVDNVECPSMYIIFNQDQAYPRYLIKYKRVANIF